MKVGINLIHTNEIYDKVRLGRTRNMCGVRAYHLECVCVCVCVCVCARTTIYHLCCCLQGHSRNKEDARYWKEEKVCEGMIMWWKK